MVSIEGLVRAHGPALLAHATRLTGGDRHTAEDVVQETWLRAWRNADKLTEDRGSVRAWLMRVAHNVAIDHHRRRQARPPEVELPEPDLVATATTPGPSEEVENRLLVTAALDTLPTRHRATLIEIYYADRTTTSAATTLGIPAGTVKSRVHKALRTLRPHLEAA
ncbi:sigma-70 family RNA polymerase sigma factor [Actinokineospora sp. NPDC004072]